MMDYQFGLRTLKARLPKDKLDEFNVHEARLRENLRRERLYGSTETTRAERAAIVDTLNRLAQTHLGMSFNDLCQPKTAPATDKVKRGLSPVEEQACLERELAQHRRNLDRLREKKAKYGIDVPISVLNQIDDEEQQIRHIEGELERLES